MGYKVKWVEDNLGITRNTIRGYEKEGLIPENTDGKDREYSEEEIELLWGIKVLQGIGYERKEIFQMRENEDFDFEKSLDEKVNQLKKKKDDAERHLGYAEMIKLSGRLPSRPTLMGSINFDEFYEKSLNDWNLNNDSQAKQVKEVTDLYLNKSQEELNESDLIKVLNMFQTIGIGLENPELFLIDNLLTKEIIKRRNLGASHPEVQLLVKMMRDNYISICPEYEKMSLDQFVRFTTSSYISGDIAKVRTLNFDEEDCKFIVDAIAVFGGYKNYNEVND